MAIKNKKTVKKTADKILFEKWEKYVSDFKYADIHSRKEALETAIFLESTFQENQEQLREYKKMIAENDAGVPITGMQPNLILPIARRLYPKIMMKNFVATQPLTTPTAVIHYLDRNYKTSKNGIQRDDLFKGFPSSYRKKDYDPFFSSDMIGGASFNDASASVLQITAGSISYRVEDAGIDDYTTVSIIPKDDDIRRVYGTVSFVYELAGSEAYVNCWLMRGKTVVNEGGISWGFRVNPVAILGNETIAKEMIEKIRTAVEAQNGVDFAVNSDNIDITFDLATIFGTATDYSVHSGWYYNNSGTIEISADTKKAYYVINPDKYPHIMNEMSFEIKTMPITLKSRSFKIRYSPKQEKIMSDYLNLNLANELTAEIADQSAFEMDREIKGYIESILDFELIDYVDLDEFKSNYQYSPFNSQMEYLYYRINLHASKMEKINKLQRPTQALISAEIGAMLSHIQTFQLFKDNVSAPAGGIYKLGSVPAKMDYYVDPLMEGNDILLACKKTNSSFASGVVFCPYYTYLSPEILSGQSTQKTKLMEISYGLEKTPFGELYYGMLKVQNVDKI